MLRAFGLLSGLCLALLPVSAAADTCSANGCSVTCNNGCGCTALGDSGCNCICLDASKDGVTLQIRGIRGTDLMSYPRIRHDLPKMLSRDSLGLLTRNSRTVNLSIRNQNQEGARRAIEALGSKQRRPSPVRPRDAE